MIVILLLFVAMTGTVILLESVGRTQVKMSQILRKSQVNQALKSGVSAARYHHLSRSPGVDIVGVVEHESVDIVVDFKTIARTDLDIAGELKSGQSQQFPLYFDVSESVSDAPNVQSIGGIMDTVVQIDGMGITENITQNTIAVDWKIYRTNTSGAVEFFTPILINPLNIGQSVCDADAILPSGFICTAEVYGQTYEFPEASTGTEIGQISPCADGSGCATSLFTFLTDGNAHTLELTNATPHSLPFIVQNLSSELPILRPVLSATYNQNNHTILTEEHTRYIVQDLYSF